MRLAIAAAVLIGLAPDGSNAQNWAKDKEAKTSQSSFRAIDEWPDPNEARSAYTRRRGTPVS
ncbi:MAG: hypothetical protein ACT4P7_22790 [Gemmatimonadaceae bacterium]